MYCVKIVLCYSGGQGPYPPMNVWPYSVRASRCIFHVLHERQEVMSPQDCGDTKE